VTGLSPAYAAMMQRGEVIPHSRFWPLLATIDSSQPASRRAPNPVNASDQRDHAAWERTHALPDVHIYKQHILPALKGVPLADLQRVMECSNAHAGKVRSGERIPHPMHWEALAKLIGVELQPYDGPGACNYEAVLWPRRRRSGAEN
jgi:hypothetical protein